MTPIVLTDRLLREALAPAPATVSLADVAQVVSERTHQRRQVRRRLPWLLSPAATFAEARRVHLVRVVLLGALLALSAGAAIAGARLWLRVEAPPQVLLLQGGLGYSVSLDGGERRPITALAGRNVIDFSLALDGSQLATLRAPRNVLEIWDAPDVLNGVATAPIALPNTGDLLVLDTGVWRPDGRSLLITASAHGAHRVYLVDVASGSTTQVSPANVYVDDWQPSFDGRWIEIAGQYQGHNELFVVDLTDLSHRSLIKSEWDRVPQGAALGWSPDSRTMTFRLQDGIQELGIWRIDVDGTDIRQVTPPGRPAWWMNWSPDGQWIAYQTSAAVPSCAGGNNREATWIVRPDGSDARLLADGALALSWAEDGRSMLVESTLPLPGAPLGGVVHAFLDGSPPELVYAYADSDNIGDVKSCHPYGALTKFYRALTRGIH